MRSGSWARFMAAAVGFVLTVVAARPAGTEAGAPSGNAVQVRLERVDAGVAVVLSSAAGLSWEAVEESQKRLVVLAPGSRSADGEREVPVNLANVSWLRVRERRSAAGSAVEVEIDFSGPVRVTRTQPGPGEMRIMITPDTGPEPVDHKSIAESSFIIDLHNDVITQLYEQGNVDLFEGDKLQTSWPRMRAAGVKGAIFAVWVPKDKGPGFEDALIEIFYGMVYRHRDQMAVARSYADVERNLAEGKFSAFLAIEGGRAVDQDVDKVDYFFHRGVRYMTLVWNITEFICDSAKDPHKPYGGLSPFGEQVVRRMNELGMLVDVSHSSDATVDDVLRITTDPIIASHSNCRAVYNHPRNLKDEHIRAICGGGGVIGVNFYSTFLSASRPARLEDVLQQVDHMAEVGGIECVALGSDYDGFIRPAAGLEDMSKLENLTNGLAKRGYSAEDIKKIYGRNFLRVLKKVVDE